MDEVLLTSLLEQYAKEPSEQVLSRLVEAFLPLTRAIARKYAGHGVEVEDLEQVGAMALVKAIQRFEPQRGLRFTTYATPTIAGEVRNYLRDRGGAMRMARDTRTLLYRLQQVSDRLTQQLQREPSLKELSEAMGLTPDALLALLDERERTSTVSLSAGVEDDGEEAALEDCLGSLDAGYEQVEQRSFYEWALSLLTPAESRLITLRFQERLGQRETARMLGVSQMQVSRMERRILARLREHMQRDEA